MYAQPTLNGVPFVPTTYGNITTFGATSIQIIPIPASYQSGYLAGQGFPAENENYFMYNITNSINLLANDLANIHAEILSVLSGQSIPVDNGVTQLNAAIGSKITSTITATYINNTLTGTGISAALQAYGGNVGIGKAPTSTLDVNGNINGSSVSIAGVDVATSISTLNSSKANIASPTFTGTVIVPVASGSTSPTQKTYVDTALGLKADISSPTFTGTVVVPVAVGNTSPTQKLYVDTQLASVNNNISGALIVNTNTNYQLISPGTAKYIIASINVTGVGVDIFAPSSTGTYLVISFPPTGTAHTRFLVSQNATIYSSAATGNYMFIYIKVT